MLSGFVRTAVKTSAIFCCALMMLMMNLSCLHLLPHMMLTHLRISLLEIYRLFTLYLVSKNRNHYILKATRILILIQSSSTMASLIILSSHLLLKSFNYLPRCTSAMVIILFATSTALPCNSSCKVLRIEGPTVIFGVQWLQFLGKVSQPHHGIHVEGFPLSHFVVTIGFYHPRYSFHNYPSSICKGGKDG